MSYTLEENTFFNTSLDYLAHYGVAGMKWGVRNEDTLRKYGLRKYGTKPIEKIGNKRAKLEKKMRNVDAKVAKNTHKIKKLQATKVDLKYNDRQYKLEKLERKLRRTKSSGYFTLDPVASFRESRRHNLEKKIAKQQKRVDRVAGKAHKQFKLQDKNEKLMRKTRKTAIKAAAMDSAVKGRGKAAIKKYRDTSVKDLQLLDWNTVSKKY